MNENFNTPDVTQTPTLNSVNNNPQINQPVDQFINQPFTQENQFGNQPINQQYYQQGYAPMYVNAQPTVLEKKENVFLGILGGLLGAIIGSVVWVVLYQLGFISGISGMIMIFLGIFLFQKFSGSPVPTKKTYIIPVIISFIMVIVSEFACVSIELIKLFNEQEVKITMASFSSSLSILLGETDVRIAIIKDLVIGYLIMGAISIGVIAKGARRH